MLKSALNKHFSVVEQNMSLIYMKNTQVPLTFRKQRGPPVRTKFGEAALNYCAVTRLIISHVSTLATVRSKLNELKKNCLLCGLYSWVPTWVCWGVWCFSLNCLEDIRKRIRLKEWGLMGSRHYWMCISQSEVTDQVIWTTAWVLESATLIVREVN